LLAFALSLSPDPQQQERKKLRVKFRYRDSKGREWETEVEYESVKTPPTGNLKIYGAMLDAEKLESRPINVWGNIWREAEPEKKYGFSTQQGQGTIQLAPAPDYTAEATGRDSFSELAMCQTPIKSGPERFAVVANETGSIRFLFIVHKGIGGDGLGKAKRWQFGAAARGDGRSVQGRSAYLLNEKRIQQRHCRQFHDSGHIVDSWLNQYGDRVSQSR